jgi:hypothetical protein
MTERSRRVRPVAHLWLRWRRGEASFRAGVVEAAFAGTGVAARAALAFRAATQRFLCAADMRRRAAGRTMRVGASASANATALSKPGGTVMSSRTPLGKVLRRSRLERIGEALPGLHGHLDALPAGGRDALAGVAASSPR